MPPGAFLVNIVLQCCIIFPHSTLSFPACRALVLPFSHGFPSPVLPPPTDYRMIWLCHQIQILCILPLNCLSGWKLSLSEQLTAMIMFELPCYGLLPGAVPFIYFLGKFMPHMLLLFFVKLNHACWLNLSSCNWHSNVRSLAEGKWKGDDLAVKFHIPAYCTPPQFLQPTEQLK